MSEQHSNVSVNASGAERTGGLKLLVAICTFNRADLLRESLESLCRIEAPAKASWTVLVVNNRCTDHTDEVLASFMDRLPLVRSFEDTPGLSNARNNVLASPQAREADYIIWTDDDVRVEPIWLRAYEAAFTRSPEACLFGGNVIPWFEEDPPPDWVLGGWESFTEAFSVRRYDGEFQLNASERRIPNGANFAIRAAELLPMRFDPKLGVVGKKWLGGEETQVMRHLLEQGHTGWWVPEATVRHFIPRARVSLRFLGKYFRGKGRTEAILLGESGSPIYRRPRWLWKQAALAWGAFLFHRARGNAAAWARDYQTANFASGRLLG